MDIQRYFWLGTNKDGKEIVTITSINKPPKEFRLTHDIDLELPDDVEEYWTPKLYIIKLPYGAESTIIACNDEHLWKCFNDESSDDCYVSFQQFKNTFKHRTIENVDEFKIIVK